MKVQIPQQGVVQESPRGGEESAGRTIYLPPDNLIANHSVHRHSSADWAAKRFLREREREFVTSGHQYGPWEVPDALTYRSPIADQYYVACEVRTGTYSMCKMIAQYEEYYVYFKTDMVLTFQELEGVLRAIDERMAECLDKPLPTDMATVPKARE